eukprot:UN22721
MKQGGHSFDWICWFSLLLLNWLVMAGDQPSAQLNFTPSFNKELHSIIFAYFLSAAGKTSQLSLFYLLIKMNLSSFFFI